MFTLMPVLHTVFFSLVFVVLKSGSVSSSTLFFFFNIVLAILGPYVSKFCFYTQRGKVFFLEKRKRKIDLAEGTVKFTLCFLSGTMQHTFSLGQGDFFSNKFCPGHSRFFFSLFNNVLI